MRARYGVDPEALGLAGPNAFADAFDASLRGMQLGETMATNALNRELARERAEQIRQDRLTEAVLSTPGSGVGGVVSGGGGGKSKSSTESVPTAAMPTMQQWFRQQPYTPVKLRAMGDTESIWGTQPGAAPVDGPEGVPEDERRVLSRVSKGEMTPEQGKLLMSDVIAMRDMRPGPVADVPMENPLTRIGYQAYQLPSIEDAARVIMRRSGLSSADKETLLRDYENYYMRQVGAYQDSMAMMMQGQRDAAAEAAELRNAQITRGLAIVQMLQDAERRNLPFPELTPEQIEDRAVALQYATQAYGVPSGETQRLRTSELAAAAPMLKARTEASEAQADRYLLEQARNEVYEQTVTEGLAEAERIANRVSELKASGVPDSELPVIPTEDDVRRRARSAMNNIIDVNSARDFFKRQSGGSEVPQMTIDEAVASLENIARRKGVNVNPMDIQFAASEIIRDPKAVSQLRRGLVSMPSGASDSVFQALQLLGLNAVTPAGSAPQTPTQTTTPTQTQTQASITQTEDGATVVELQ